MCGVLSADATISAADIAPIGPVPLSVGQRSVEGSVPGVPAGSGRTVRVEAFGASGRRVYFGSTLVDVSAGGTTAAALVLEQDTTNCPASGTGTVIITGVISPGGGAPDGGTVPDGGVVVPVPGLALTPEQIELDQTGVLYLLDRGASRVHRLSLPQRVMLPPLVGTLPALTMTVAPDSGVSPSDIRKVPLTASTLGAEVDSPSHGSYILSGRRTLLPDETGVLVGSGIVFETRDLTYRASVGLSFTDAVFHGGNLYLAEPVASSTMIRVLDSAFNILSTTSYPGKVARLFVWQRQLVMMMTTSVGVEVRLVPL